MAKMGRFLRSVAKCCVRDFFAKGDIHRSLGQRPRTLVSFRCLLANGHSQASSAPNVLFIEFDAITVQKVAILFLESSRYMAPEFLASEFHALIFPSPSQGMGDAGCAGRGLAADGSHFAESQAFFKVRCRFSLPIWTDSSLRIRIRTMLGTSSGGGAALTNRLFSVTPDSGCVGHGFGLQFCKGIEGHAARGAWTECCQQFRISQS